MDNKFVLSPGFNEVVFEKRNKKYGAYEIRRKYTRFAIIAAASAILFFTGGSLTWASMMDENENRHLVGIEVDLTPSIPKIGDPAKEKIETPKEQPITKATPPLGPKSSVLTSNIDITEDPTTPPPSNLGAGADPKGKEGGTGSGPVGPGDCLDCLPVDSTPKAPVIIEWSNNPPTCEGLDGHIRNKIRYPDVCRELGIEGTVYVQFIVDTKGNYRDVEVMKGPHPALNAEALRVMSSMPAWTPAKDDNGNLVEFRMRKPIRFQLAK